jgi:hypothetical protein
MTEDKNGELLALADLSDAFRFMAMQAILKGQRAVGSGAGEALSDMLSGHYEVVAFNRAAGLVENWQKGRGEPMGPSVESMAAAYRRAATPPVESRP